MSEILIYPKSQNHKEVKLYKEKEGWRVTLPSGGSAKVLNERISNLFTQLIAIKPKRLAARDESKWNELQVDSTGSRIKVFEGSKQTLDLVIGRFSFQQPRTMNTFVRLYNDKDVYEVDGFLPRDSCVTAIRTRPTRRSCKATSTPIRRLISRSTSRATFR